jgi:hypothetical protein
LLLLVALGQMAAAAHALDHGIADQPERCATCVHFDQGSQVPVSNATIAITHFASADAAIISYATVPLVPAAHFDARAPPL